MRLNHQTRRWLRWGVLAVVIIAAFIGTTYVYAQTNKVAIYFFWGDGCPHCAEAKPFLAELAKDNPAVEVNSYEVWYDKDNQKLMLQMAEAFGFEPRAVPTIFIGDRHWEGFSVDIANDIKAVVDTCVKGGCRNAGAGIIPGVTDQPEPVKEPVIDESGKILTLPLIGKVDLSSQSLIVSTLLISFVDGFNPCSLWVLSMLLALTLHTGSRKKVIIIGLIFLTVTAAVYALFITGLFTIFKVVSFIGWIQVVVAVIALIFGLVNIKDYFWYKEGLTFTISDTKKPGIFQRIRRIMDASQNIWAMAGATVVMAAGVSLVEFSCTAGFPVLWTNLLVSQQTGAVAFSLLLLVYMLVYQLDELVVFFTAAFTLKSNRLEEKQGRILKLIGGSLMLTLAVVMIVNPQLMSNLGTSLLIFAIAFGAALLVLVLHRKVLPSFGIWIGSEAQSHRKRRGTGQKHKSHKH